MTHEYFELTEQALIKLSIFPAQAHFDRKKFLEVVSAVSFKFCWPRYFDHD